MLLFVSLSEDSFTKSIINAIYNSFPETHFDIKSSDLASQAFSENLLKRKRDFLSEEFEKLAKSDYFIVVFPYLVTGIPGIIKEWFDIVLEKEKCLDFSKPTSCRLLNQGKLQNKKALTITYTDFPQEAFKPNALHQSTIKKRLHHFNWLTLKYIGMDPCEPIVYYSSNSKAVSSQQFSHTSTIESFKYNSKKTNKDNEKTINNNNNNAQNISNNISAINGENARAAETNDNDKESRSFSKMSLMNKKGKQLDNKAKEEFLIEVSKCVKKIERFQILDITDI